MISVSLSCVQRWTGTNFPPTPFLNESWFLDLVKTTRTSWNHIMGLHEFQRYNENDINFLRLNKRTSLHFDQGTHKVTSSFICSDRPKLVVKEREGDVRWNGKQLGLFPTVLTTWSVQEIPTHGVHVYFAFDIHIKLGNLPLSYLVNMKKMRSYHPRNLNNPE